MYTDLTPGPRDYTEEPPSATCEMEVVAGGRFYPELYEGGSFNARNIAVLQDAIRTLANSEIRCYPDRNGNFTSFWLSNAPIQFHLGEDRASLEIHIPSRDNILNDLVPYKDRLHETLNFLFAVSDYLSR